MSDISMELRGMSCGGSGIKPVPKFTFERVNKVDNLVDFEELLGDAE